MRVIVCSMFSPSHQELADISVPNLQEYANRHGYELRIINIENDKWEYKKHEAFKEWMDKDECDLIWYKDVDSLITNLSIPIESFVDDENVFYLTKDFNEINGGSVIIKNTIGGRMFNDMVLENGGMFENEQNLFNSFPILVFGVDFMKTLSHPSINSYKYDLYPECKSHVGREDLGDWQPGNFVIHFPALQLKDRIELMKWYSQKIIR